MEERKKKKEFDLVKAGTHLLAMSAFDIKPLKNGKGEAAEVRYLVRGKDNPDKDKLIFDRFILKHESEKAVEIGKKRLDAYVKAVNNGEGLESIGFDYTKINDELMGIPFNGVVDVEAGNEYKDAVTGENKKGKDKNIVRYFNQR